jgi:hypothetical protein
MTVEMENILAESMRKEDESIELGQEYDSLRETIDYMLGINEDGTIDPSSEPLF